MNNFKTTIFKTLMAIMGLLLVGSTNVIAQDVELDFGGNLSGRPGESFTIEVTTSALTGLGVNNFEFDFSFDSDLINVTADGIEAGDLVDNITKNVTSDDRILVQYASSSSISGEGVLFTISGTLNNIGANTNGLTLTDYLIGDGSLDVSPDAPYDITVQVSETIISLPDITGTAGDTFSAAITTDDLSALNIQSYDLEFTYDADALSFTGIDIAGTASEGGIAEFNTPEDGRGLLSVAFTTPISSDSDILAYLEGTIDADLGASDLTFTKVEFFNSNGESVAIAGVSGSVFTGENVAPVFTSVLPDTTVEEGSTLTYTYMATDAGTVTYSLGDATPEGATIDTTSGEFSLELVPGTAGTHTIEVIASDGTLSDTTSATLTVTDVPTSTIAEARAAAEGTTVEVTGIVTTPDFGFSINQFYMQDETAGINVVGFDYPVNADGDDTPFAATQEITIIGEVNTYEDSQELQLSIDSYTVVSTGNLLPEAMVIDDASEFSVDSPYQGMRVELPNVNLVDASQWPTEKIESGSGVNVDVEGNLDLSGSEFVLRIDRDESEFDPSEAPDGDFKIAGVLGRFLDTPQLFIFFEDDFEIVSNERPGEVPSQFALNNNYPNPFNPTTNISYSVPQASDVTLNVYNALGQHISTLVNTRQSPGNYTVTFDAANLTSGVYFVRIKAGNFVDSKKMLLLK